MESSQDSFPHELSREEYEHEQCPFESDWEYDKLSRPFHDDIEADEEPEEDNVFLTNDFSYSDDDEVQEADEELSVDEEYVQDCVEYVHFGKGLEYDREWWIWKKDVDFESEISRCFSPFCHFI
jgi:hypothetical protein